MRIGFAGSGSMAGAMARGWARCGAPPEAMIFSDAGSGRARGLADELGGERAESLGDLAERSNLIVLAVKPAGLADAAPAIAGRVDGVISVLGATPLPLLEEALAPTPVLRTMPNVAVEVCRGVVCHTPAPADGPLARAVELLRSLGSVIELPDEQMDPATAVMGCAPAWFALAAEALIEAGAAAGLEPELSRRLVCEALAGLGEHLLHRPDPAAMQRAIASPGGSTEAGLESLARAGVPAAYREAVTASLERMAGSS